VRHEESPGEAVYPRWGNCEETAMHKMILALTLFGLLASGPAYSKCPWGTRVESASATMTTVTVDGETFYVGENEDWDEDSLKRFAQVRREEREVMRKRHGVV